MAFLDASKKMIIIEDDFLFVMGLLLMCVAGIYLISILVMNIWIFVDKRFFCKRINNLPCVEIDEWL